MDQNGRILIPLEIRKQYNMSPGDNFILKTDETSINICRIDTVIDEMHALFFKHKPKVAGKSILEDFLEERRRESKLEQQDFIEDKREGENE